MQAYIELVKMEGKMNIKDFSSQYNTNDKKGKTEKENKNGEKTNMEPETNKNDYINNNANADFEKIIETDEFKQVENEYGDTVRDFLSKYGEMEESELLAEMLRLIAEKKAEGTFDAEKIKALATQIAPLLNAEQQEKMYNLLKYLD